MKIPALRAQISDWTYYVTTLTFQQISDCVSDIDSELHKSETLKDLIQRSITLNYLSIKNYILNQQEFFFNSLVLAVYDDYPDWKEIEVTYENQETYQLGLLEFPGKFKIFAVDGQHRVKGIKFALLDQPDLANQRIPAIFIGHKNDNPGMQRTRRLFTTLNRYAKPVALNDIIALDEDDVVAITTRSLIEDYDLFSGKRLVNAKQKAIPANNLEALTSIITLYQSNIELFKSFYAENYGHKATPVKLTEKLKVRPPQEEIEAFEDFCLRFWDAFKNNLDVVGAFVQEPENPAAHFRNNETGGNLIFRPIGFLPLVKVALLIHDRAEVEFTEIFNRFNQISFDLNLKPWLYVAWNPTTQRMIMRSDSVILLLLLYLYDPNLLTAAETNSLKRSYASKIAYQGDDLEGVLEGF